MDWMSGLISSVVFIWMFMSKLSTDCQTPMNVLLQNIGKDTNDLRCGCSLTLEKDS